jgi:hypothetical protein
MNYWMMFWTGALVIAGCSFAVITAIVSVFGYRDLMQMFRRLTAQGGKEKENE